MASAVSAGCQSLSGSPGDAEMSVDYQERSAARLIWEAGVASVFSRPLVQDSLEALEDRLVVHGQPYPLSDKSRVLVVGAGKAGAGMAEGVEDVLSSKWFRDRLSGWVNVPADCIRPLAKIHLHAARPAGVNEPTPEGVEGSQQILEQVSQLGPDDLCLVLISGGGSALLPAPVDGLSLADKVTLTRLLSRAGATIQQLNCVRKQLSKIKGGGLARVCRAPLVSLIISDVAGDPLDVISSGPTVPDSGTATEAIQILTELIPDRRQVPDAVWAILEAKSRQSAAESASFAHVRNFVIGNNRIAVEAAAAAADKVTRIRHGDVRILGWDQGGVAREVGTALASEAVRVQNEMPAGMGPVCLISGGEPVVRVASTGRPQKGGRNQELALAALAYLEQENARGITVLSGGTDGEDGPTDAAGAVVDDDVLARTRELGLDPRAYLDDNNSYPFFEQTGGLLKTGPTHTNVMDLRVVYIMPPGVG